MASALETLKSGEIARLIPVIADSRREQRVASVFLATLSAVPDFADAIFSAAGLRLGKRSVVDTYTEVVLKNQNQKQPKERPDGLVVINSGKKKTWTALVEAKIGNSSLDESQVHSYLQVARDNGIDAVITISNQFVARPTHSPIKVPKTLTRRVSLLHWSWRNIVTEAIILQSREAVSDPDQAFILREFVRFISHSSVGVTDFSEMPSAWRDAATLIKGGGIVGKTSTEAESIVSAWHQETRDLALKLSQHLASKVEVRLSRAHANDPDQRLKDDCAKLSGSNTLEAEYNIPNAASPLIVRADLKAQTIIVGMTVDAPSDRQRTSARINWLLRQIKQVKDEALFVRITWPSRAKDTVCKLEDLRIDSKVVPDSSSLPPRSFEVFTLSDDARRFQGRRRFIEELERLVPAFYDSVGQRLERWVPKPPKPVREKERPDGQPDSPHAPVQATRDGARVGRNGPGSGNAHTDLLEIPDFLRRQPAAQHLSPFYSGLTGQERKEPPDTFE